MKNVHRIRNKQNSARKQCVWCTVLLEGVKLSYPHKCVKVIILGVFVATTLKLQQFVVSKPDKVRHLRRAAIQQVC